MLRSVVVCACVVAMAACQRSRDEADPTPRHRSAPADSIAEVPGLTPATVVPPAGSQTPNLFVTAGGEVISTWVEPAEGSTLELRLVKRTDQGWSAPVTVVRGELFDNWADFPAAAALPDGTLVATWLEPHAQRDGYGIRWSRSTDEGQHWSSPEILHAYTDGPEFGFVSWATAADDALSVFWLDGRNSQSGGGGVMQLRTATIGREGPPRDRALVDSMVCDCCQTSAVGTPHGPRVAYRNRSLDEVRDIWIASPAPESESDSGRRIHEDGWWIEGCPVNGPSLAAHAEGLVAAWFTGAEQQSVVYVAFAAGDGEFSKPMRVDRGDPIGRVSVVALDATSALVTFMEREPGKPEDAAILTRFVRVGEEPGPPHLVARTGAGRSSGFPRTARTKDRVVYAWTDTTSGRPTARFAEAPLASLRPAS